MTTLSVLKSTIANDLARSDLTSEIAAAIEEAIRHYSAERFWFNERRSGTFSTVASTREYTTSETAIAAIMRLDAVFITVSGRKYPLILMDPITMELLDDDSTSTGPPAQYSYFDRSLFLYPTPDQAYTVRLMGHMKAAAPADDTEADNVWMTEAFELLRCKATQLIAGHVNIDTELLQLMTAGEGMALQRLRAETTRRTASGFVTPTEF